jgi:hypothetical protein
LTCHFAFQNGEYNSSSTVAALLARLSVSAIGDFPAFSARTADDAEGQPRAQTNQPIGF